MSKKTYPEEIYPKYGFKTDAFGRLTQWTTCNSDFERAYDLGFKNGRLKADLETNAPLVGWSNLTAAIKAGERIDWGALDGLEAQCVHPEMGALTYKLERDKHFSIYSSIGWCAASERPIAWGHVLYFAWTGEGDWSLWVKGDIPLRKRTADQLEPGTCFRARYKKNGETHNYAWAQLLKPSGQNPRVIFFSLALTTLFGSALPEEVEVVEVYGVGTFKKPKGDA